MKLLTQKIKKILATLLLIVILSTQSISVAVYAETSESTPTETVAEQPATPEQPKVPETPATPEQPETPATPDKPATPEQPKAPEAPRKPGQEKTPEEKLADERRAAAIQNYFEQREKAKNQTTNNTGASSNGNVGDTSVKTGDANNTSTVTTTGNTNAAATPGKSGGSAVVSNTNNGAGSSNSGSTTNNISSNTTQNNSAGVQNGLTQSAVTGDGSVSYNVGDSSIKTGDANTTATVVTAVNTNVDGVAVAEFNIADDHVGDIILDYNQACTQGCNGSTVATNNANGAGSSNDASSTNNNTNNTDQTNTATVGSNLTLSANSGNNDANFNTGGDSNIETGDANVSANVVTFANNNIAGNVVYGVVNIFGNLIGDIIIPDSMIEDSCATCGGGTTASNTNNGAGSSNDSQAVNNSTTNTNQFNTANIDNNLVLGASTGENDSSYNTGGNSSITTGDTNIVANVLNIANTNLSGGTYWLVIVNEAGKWIGKIMGTPDGQNYAGSTEFAFDVAPDGSVTASNNKNGAGSENTANTTSNNNTTTTQTNTANIENNLNLSANTGGNDANFNTGGDSNIKTGDANIIANIVNFVNNNIVGDGKLVVTVVNVFGSWVGDLVTPGQQKAPKDTVAQTNNNQSSNIGGVSSVAQSVETSHHTDTPANTSSPAVYAKVVTAQYSGGNVSTATALVAGIQSKVGSALHKDNTNSLTAATDQVTINLAWLLLVLPAGLVTFKVGKRFAHRFATK